MGCAGPAARLSLTDRAKSMVMKSTSFELMLVVLATVVVTLVARWAWDEFKVWRINRQYGPDRRSGPSRGRDARRSPGEGGRSTD